MSVYVIRAFVRLREEQTANAVILKRLAEIDRTLLQHDAALSDIYRKLLPLLQPPAEREFVLARAAQDHAVLLTADKEDACQNRRGVPRRRLRTSGDLHAGGIDGGLK